MSEQDNLWDFYGQPKEPPQELSYQLRPREFATVTPMGNWLAMQADRDRWRATAESLARQLGKIDYAIATYEDLGETL